MTPKEEKAVLIWLRQRGEGLYGGPRRPRTILQRALRSGKPISRDIRDAMADWIEADPTGLVLNQEAFEEVCSMASSLEELALSLEEREAKLQAQINANPDIQALIARHRAEAKPAPASPADPTGLVHRSWLKPATNHGDAISSLMKAEGLTFPEAVERLAKS